MRERSVALFALLADAAYYSQPIALRHPIVFYDGHLPAFSFNTLVAKTLGRDRIDPRLEALFARGIDPNERAPAASDVVDARAIWPDRETVREFTAEADRRVLAALAEIDPEEGSGRADRTVRECTEAVQAVFEHEAMHQETLLYMWHRLPFELKRRPAGDVVGEEDRDGLVPPAEWVEVPDGMATLGVDRDTIPFGWDNEHPAYRVHVPAFAIERHDVTNARYLDFVNAGGYRDARWWTAEDWAWVRSERVEHPLFWEHQDESWHWRGMFEPVPLPWSCPVYVSHAEAAAFARWRGARLPTEAEFQRAAFGAPAGERPHPWGEQPPEPGFGVFDFSAWDPRPAGSHPLGASAWGVEDLVGNGWEWTSTPFGPFPGFQPMSSYPEYSADFFDGEHFVMKGASPATARDLIRPTFRNWFRTRYPYVYATFRCVRASRS